MILISIFDTDIYPYHALLSLEILTFPETCLVAFSWFQVIPSLHIIDHQEVLTCPMCHNVLLDDDSRMVM